MVIIGVQTPSFLLQAARLENFKQQHKALSVTELNFIQYLTQFTAQVSTRLKDEIV